MGTERRLKKLVREEAKKLGHDIGCWIKQSDGSWHAKCVICNCPAAIFTQEHIDAKLVHGGRNNHLIDIEEAKWRSGVTWKEMHPKLSKGTVSGMILSINCGSDICKMFK